MSLISIKNLTFCYDGSYDNIFENINLSLDTSWHLGFTGRNGRGKTTFMRILLGELEYDGDIIASTKFEYFPFEIQDTNLLTFEALQEINPDFENWQLERELNILGADTDIVYKPYNLLSGGEKTKVLIATMFLKENNFLLIDEPTNHLDYKGRQILADYLINKSGYILISHDRDFLDKCTDHTLSINKTDITVQNGNFSSFLKNKEMQDNYEIAKNEKLKSEIKSMSESSREKSKWSEKIESSKIGEHSADRGHIGRMAAKMAKRSKVIENRMQKGIEERQTLLKNIEETEKLKLSFLSPATPRMVELNKLSLFYDDKCIVNNLSFIVSQGERVAVRGANGCGKSSVIKLLLGEEICFTGEFYIAKNLIVSYVQQSIPDFVGSLDELAIQENIDITLFKTILRKLGFDRVHFEKNIQDYSAGQKKKVCLAKSLCSKAHLYIWDEPLNYIDILSRMQIENLIIEYKPTIIFIEHDEAFIRNCATKIVDL